MMSYDIQTSDNACSDPPPQAWRTLHDVIFQGAALAFPVMAHRLVYRHRSALAIGVGSFVVTCEREFIDVACVYVS